MSWLKQQHGDTLIEVIFAIIILSVVLMGALALGRLSRVNSLNSQLRTQTINLVQEQYEALKSYRDSVTWQQFLAGININGGNGSQIHMERDTNTASPTYDKWIPCPNSWRPPVDYDSTWSTFGTCAHASSSTNITVSIKLLDNPNPGLCGDSFSFPFEIDGNYTRGGTSSASTIHLNTVLGDIKGNPGC